MISTKKIFTILMLILIFGCMKQAEQQEGIYTEEFRTGNEGLRLNFVQNIPPEILYDTEPFAAMIEITNQGTHTVGGTGDRIYLSGFDPAVIQGIPTTGKQIPEITGKSQYITEPGIGAVDFRATIRDIASLRMDKYPLNIMATACYDYETIASTGICLDPDPYSPTAKQKICTPENIMLGSQGAPIAIEEIEVMPAKGTTKLRIHIKNAGYGDAFKQGIQYLEKCSPYSAGLAFDEIGYIQLGDVLISGVNIKQTCKPIDSTGHIRLTNGQATILCEIKNIRSQTPYMTAMSIVLKYGYRNSIFQQLEIKPTY